MPFMNLSTTNIFYNIYGLFFSDLYFFLFETFFLFFLVFLLIFFVIVFNQKCKSFYYNSLKPLISLSLFSLLLSLLILLNNTFNFSIFNGFYYTDDFALFFKFLILLGFIIFLPLFLTYISNIKNYDFEFFIVILLSIFSTVLLINSNDLISFFFVIELQSLSFYILVSSKQVSSFSTEAGLKYFILGCFSSGLMLFGISLIYGFTGLLSFYDLEVFSSAIFDLYLTNKSVFTGFVLGVFLVTVGLLFKFGASPFHM
jgi:NADH:ubiquinone oxidoreductase subunit 2 (subunit N)